MLGFLFFIDSVANVPHYLVLFVIFIYVIIARNKQIIVGLNNNRHFVCFLGFFLLLCIVNVVVHGFPGVPNIILMPLGLMCAFAINRNDVKIFVILVFFECFIGFYEYALGISSILPGENNTGEFLDDELLYFKRVMGICGNSSSYALQLLFSVMFVIGFGDLFKKKYRFIFVVTFLIGLFTTFNRTAIGVTFIYIIIELFLKFKYLFEQKKRQAVPFAFFLLCLLFISIVFYGEQIQSQFNRGGDSVDLTGRPYIWANFLSFIESHPIGGNGSVHYLIPYFHGNIAHAHNSFLQIIADHGVILSFFYFFIIMSKINKCNIKFCLVLFFTSITQYILFWGFSFADTLLFAFLCNSSFYLTKNFQCQLVNK